MASARTSLRSSLTAAPCARPAICMVDVSLLADASTVTLEQLEALAKQSEPHYWEGFSTYWDDIVHTMGGAALGLAGAYVTVGTEGAEPPQPDEGPRVSRKRRRRQAALQAEAWEREISGRE